MPSIARVATAAPRGGPVARKTDPETETEKQRERERPRGVSERRDWSALPRPDHSSGLEVEPAGPSPMWWIPRAALFIPRVAFEVVEAPFRGALWLTDRFQLEQQYYDIFYNDTRTFGIYPTLYYDTGFGVTFGAHLADTDLAGQGETLDAEARWGGSYNWKLIFDMTSGARFGNLRVYLDSAYERMPHERFFGIGNADTVEPEEVTGLIDPLTNDTAVSTRFREARANAILTGSYDFGNNFFIYSRHQIERRSFGPAQNLYGDVQLTDVYNPMDVIGFDNPFTTIYNETELRYDSRRRGDRFASRAMPARGWLLSARLGWNASLAGGGSGFFQGTADVQRYFNIYTGSRVLGLRALATQISADVDNIPFVYLPALGGPTLLRGYSRERFRDRAAYLGTAEYKWEIVPKVGAAAFLFVDAGRVENSLLDFDFGNLRVGYGGGVQLQTLQSFILRVNLASSIDGGVFLNLALNTVINREIGQVMRK